MPYHWDLTPDSPVPWVKELLQQPPGPFPDGWFGYANVAEAFRELMHEAAQRVPEPPVWTHERGIVICGGGWRFFPSLFVTIACIRKTGCTLPSRLLGGWELKPLAAAYCPYKEVLSLDADSYPAYNPEIFMDHPEFRRVGAAFWPDQGKLEPGQWERFGMPFHDEAAWESGQFIVDKSRHWKPLWFTSWMNDHSDYVYKHVYGDKDTFHLSWRFCGHDVCVPTQVPGWHICAFIQMDFAGNCLFCHRTRDKFRWPGGHIDGQEVQNAYMTGQWYGHVERIPGLPHEDFAHDMLRYSDELLRPELHFQFIDGPAGWCRALWDQVYLANEYAIPAQFTDADVILDIGAHVGAFTRACLRRGAGHVLAVEPLAANVACLQHNIGGYESRVTIRNVAAWDTDTTLVLNEASCHEPGNTSTFSAFLPAAEQGWEVQAVSIDTLIDDACALSPRGRVRLLKIDAEGAEYPALLTAEKLHLVEEICGESHNNVPWQDDLPGIAGLTHRLEEQGFVVTHTDNGPNTSIFWARRQPC